MRSFPFKASSPTTTFPTATDQTTSQSSLSSNGLTLRRRKKVDSSFSMELSDHSVFRNWTRRSSSTIARRYPLRRRVKVINFIKNCFTFPPKKMYLWVHKCMKRIRRLTTMKLYSTGEAWVKQKFIKKFHNFFMVSFFGIYVNRWPNLETFTSLLLNKKVWVNLSIFFFHFNRLSRSSRGVFNAGRGGEINLRERSKQSDIAARLSRRQTQTCSHRRTAD